MNQFKKQPFIISGPCSVETREQTLSTCCALAETGRVNMLRGGVWKPRTKPGCFEGVGEIGLEWIREAKVATGLPITVEVASAKHVEAALKHDVDCLWIGARTTVSPFSVQEIADAVKGVKIQILIKNPVNPDVDLWTGAVERIQNSGVNQIGLIHRGFSSFASCGLRNVPLWHLAVEMRRRFKEMDIYCDPSHISGDRNLIWEIAQQAADLQYDGLMVESHCNPKNALSDNAQQVTPNDLISILDRISWEKKKITRADFYDKIDCLRSQIDQCDVEIIELISNRMMIAEKIGAVKQQNGINVYQTQRWEAVVKRIMEDSSRLGLSDDFLISYLECLHKESVRHQDEVAVQR